MKVKKLRNKMTELQTTINHLRVKVVSKRVPKFHVNHGVGNHQDEDMELDNHDADLGHASVAAPADAVPACAHGHGQVGEVAQWQYWRGARWLFYQDEWWLYYHGEWWRQALCWLRWQPDLVQ